MNNEITCPKCGKTILLSDKYCPYCGSLIKQRENNNKKLYIISFVVCCIFVLVFMIFYSRSKTYSREYDNANSFFQTIINDNLSKEAYIDILKEQGYSDRTIDAVLESSGIDFNNNARLTALDYFDSHIDDFMYDNIDYICSSLITMLEQEGSFSIEESESAVRSIPREHILIKIAEAKYNDTVVSSTYYGSLEKTRKYSDYFSLYWDLKNNNRFNNNDLDIIVNHFNMFGNDDAVYLLQAYLVYDDLSPTSVIYSSNGKETIINFKSKKSIYDFFSFYSIDTYSFSSNSIDYAISYCGIDFYNNAKTNANQLLSNFYYDFNNDRSEIRRYLINDLTTYGYTYDEAVSAVNYVGY